jgi:uncharacterized protein
LNEQRMKLSLIRWGMVAPLVALTVAGGVVVAAKSNTALAGAGGVVASVTLAAPSGLPSAIPVASAAVASAPPAPAVTVVSSSAASPTPVFKIWTVGDSTAQALGEEFDRQTKGDKALKSSLLFRNSSGLVRRDFHDWPKVISGLLAHPPNVAVISLGANDTQGMFAPGNRTTPVQPGTEGWRDEYARRMSEFIQLFIAKGVRVYVVGQAHDPGRHFAPMLNTVNDALKAAVALNSGVTYIDAAAWLADPQGRYQVTAPNKTGRTVTLRNVDGIHLSGDGGAILADRIYQQIQADRAAL